jgi:hypothetical protein
MATTHKRLSLLELTPSLAPLCRAIHNEIEDLCSSIGEEASLSQDLQAIAIAMADRRHLIGWLRRLGLPPAAAANDTCITEQVEQILLMTACEQECDQ